jgi:predicted nucleic acid-binding protein
VLISLSFIEKLHFLEKRFPGGIIIPKAVWKEVVDEGKGRPGSLEISAASWISVQNVKEKNLVGLLRSELDEGEAEAITLAHEIKADVLLIDERDARIAAKKLGIKVLGTIGLLAWAKKSGLISSLRDEMNNLQKVGKFRISEELYSRVLSDANE